MNNDRKHNHYFKDVSKLDTVDVYRVLELFNVANPSIAHAVKKLLVAGGRGAGKDITQDINEAIDSLQRWKDMREEDAAEHPAAAVGRAANRVYDLLLPDDGHARKEGRRFLEQHAPELFNSLLLGEQREAFLAAHDITTTGRDRGQP